MLATEEESRALAEELDAHAGALLAVGILNCGVQHENDPAYALLHDFVGKADPVVRTGAIMGLGLAYAGTQKEEVGPPPVWDMVHVAASCRSEICSRIGLLGRRPGGRHSERQIWPKCLVQQQYCQAAA